jgi:hypothetical protein
MEGALAAEAAARGAVVDIVAQGVIVDSWGSQGMAECAKKNKRDETGVGTKKKKKKKTQKVASPRTPPSDEESRRLHESIKAKQGEA